MMKWLKQAGFLGLVVTLVATIGCEWSSSGDGGSYNSGPSWVNFSGVYKAPSGGVLVSKFSTGTGGTPGSTNAVPVTGEGVGVGNGTNTTFSGTLSSPPIQPGSVSISAGGFDLNDNGDGGLSGSGATGAIDYGTGAWSIDLQGIPLGFGEPITADYIAVVITGGSAGSGTGQAGSSGKAIFSFVVFQTGNKIEITDNNGAKYTGRFGNVVTTSGITGETDDKKTDALLPSIGDSVVGEYTAEGTSAAGKQVLLAGTFHGVIGRGSDTALFLTDRRMLGTWVESKGVTGDINGQASPIGITVDTTTAP